MRNKCGTCACSINWCWLLVNFSAKHHNSFWPQWIIICWIESYSFAMTGKQRHEWVSTKWLLSNNSRHKAVVQLWHRFIYLFIWKFTPASHHDSHCVFPKNISVACIDSIAVILITFHWFKSKQVLIWIMTSTFPQSGLWHWDCWVTADHVRVTIKSKIFPSLPFSPFVWQPGKISRPLTVSMLMSLSKSFSHGDGKNV